MIKKQSLVQNIFTCQKCDAQSPKWGGQCLECGSWGTMSAETVRTGRVEEQKQKKRMIPAAAITSLSNVQAVHDKRIKSGLAELDRVFGGGLVAGSVTLIGGEPGIGKSTLSLMLASRIAAAGTVIYVSGEESAGQIKMRADRLALPSQKLCFLGETDVETVIATLEKEKPLLAVIDSVQTLFTDDVPSEAGAVGQIRAVTAKLVGFAKSSGTPLVLIGHVTKDGQVAGPKTLEHLVDTVLSFEGERTHSLRILRSLKNRFGSTDESGIFEMTEAGLVEIKSPSAFLLEDRRTGTPGSVISCVMEGSRPMLVEIQALVQKTSFGYPVRRASGIDQSRLEMLIAILGRRGNINLSESDVYVNVVGGIKIKEPAVDLAVIVAIASAYKNIPLPEGLAAWGEVGLGGEVRSVVAADKRLQEAASLGMKQAMTALPKKIKMPSGIAVREVKTIKDAL